MRRTSQSGIKAGIANTFGSLGYFFAALQWFWAVMLYFSIIKSFTLFVSPHADTPTAPPNASFTLPGWLEATIVIAITVIMILVTIYALVTMPSKITKNSRKVVHKTTVAAAPIIIKAQHKKDTKKRRIKITTRLTLVLKGILVVVPIVLAVTSGLLDTPSVDYSIATAVGYGLAVLSVVFFLLQYLLATMLRVKLSNLW